MFRKGLALPDENNDAATSVRDIRREIDKPGVGAIRSQSRESRDLERGRWIGIVFLDTNKVNEMRQKKM